MEEGAEPPVEAEPGPAAPTAEEEPQHEPQEDLQPPDEAPQAQEQDEAEAEMQVNDTVEQEPQQGVNASTQDYYSTRSDAAEAASNSEPEAREVTFIIQPEGYRHSELVYLNEPVAQVAELLESRLGIPAHSLRLSMGDGLQLQRDQTLASAAEVVRAYTYIHTFDLQDRSTSARIRLGVRAHLSSETGAQRFAHLPRSSA